MPAEHIIIFTTIDYIIAALATLTIICALIFIGCVFYRIFADLEFRHLNKYLKKKGCKKCG